jgi:Flp pilus assembly protein TadD
MLNARCWARVRLGVELDKALADCDDAIDQHDDDGAFFDSRGWVHLRRGEWRDARRDFDRALKLRADGAWSLYGRGLVRARTGDAEGARVDLEAARKLTPDIDERVRKEGVAGDLQPPAPLAAAPAASGAAH